MLNFPTKCRLSVKIHRAQGLIISLTGRQFLSLFLVPSGASKHTLKIHTRTHCCFVFFFFPFRFINNPIQKKALRNPEREGTRRNKQLTGERQGNPAGRRHVWRTHFSSMTSGGCNWFYSFHDKYLNPTLFHRDFPIFFNIFLSSMLQI